MQPDSIAITRKTGYDPEAKQLHYHNAGEIIFVFSGSLQMELNGRDVPIEASSLLVVGPFVSHTLQTASKDCERYILRFPLAFLNESVKDPALAMLFTRYVPDSLPLFSVTDDIFSTIMELFTLFEKELTDLEDYCYQRCGVLICALLITLYRQDRSLFLANRTPIAKKMMDIQFFLNAHYEEQVTLDGLSSRFGISKYYMSRCFEQFTGLSIKRYLTAIRVNEAKRLLCNTNNPVSAIAEKTGFFDATHFIKVFKAQENKTPLQYRKHLLR
jgi:AraC-like DNA-binding protein